MKTTTATTLTAAMVLAAVTSAVPGSAAEGAWEGNYACQITSPQRGDAPRVNLLATRKGDIGGELSSAVRLRLFNIPRLSDEERAAFPDTVVEIPGFASWGGIKADGRQENAGYSLYIPLPDIARVVGPMEGGRMLRVEVQAKDGARTIEVDLTGSAKAIASFRVCST